MKNISRRQKRSDLDEKKLRKQDLTTEYLTERYNSHDLNKLFSNSQNVREFLHGEEPVGNSEEASPRIFEGVKDFFSSLPLGITLKLSNVPDVGYHHIPHNLPHHHIPNIPLHIKPLQDPRINPSPISLPNFITKTHDFHKLASIPLKTYDYPKISKPVTLNRIGRPSFLRDSHDLNSLHDKHPSRACTFVSCRELAFFCASRQLLRGKRQISTVNGQPFSCGLYEVCCNLDNFSDLDKGNGQCGRTNHEELKGRISNIFPEEGDAEFAEYPWQAAVLRKEGVDNVYICAGTLIDDRHVVTAAHCVEGYRSEDLRVRLGEYDVNRETEFYPHYETEASRLYIHPEFFSGNLINDIAVIRLSNPINFNINPHVSPACLPTQSQDLSGRRCWVSGWGKNVQGSSGNYQNVLKEVDVPIIDTDECQDRLRRTRLGPQYFLHPGMMCAGGEVGKDACKGDGGGPLSCEGPRGSWTVVGIVSWGIGCGERGIPGVYVNLEYYTGWIKQIQRRT